MTPTLVSALPHVCDWANVAPPLSCERALSRTQRPCWSYRVDNQRRGTAERERASFGLGKITPTDPGSVGPASEHRPQVTQDNNTNTAKYKVTC